MRQEAGTVLQEWGAESLGHWGSNYFPTRTHGTKDTSQRALGLAQLWMHYLAATPFSYSRAHWNGSGEKS